MFCSLPVVQLCTRRTLRPPSRANSNTYDFFVCFEVPLSLQLIPQKLSVRLAQSGLGSNNNKYTRKLTHCTYYTSQGHNDDANVTQDHNDDNFDERLLLGVSRCRGIGAPSGIMLLTCSTIVHPSHFAPAE